MLFDELREVHIPESTDFYVMLEINGPFDEEEKLQFNYLLNNGMATYLAEDRYGFSVKLPSEEHILTLLEYLKKLISNYKETFLDADREIFKTLRALGNFDLNFDDLELIQEIGDILQ